MTSIYRQLTRLWRAGAPSSVPETKKSKGNALIALHSAGQARWTPRNYEVLVREGFAGNAIGYRAVRMIAEAAASVPWLLYDGADELDVHPLFDLLTRPNPGQSGRSLMEMFYGHLQVTGNAYLEACAMDGEVRELHVLRADRMKVVPGNSGWPEAYEYSVSGQTVRFVQDGSGPVPPILHARLFNPVDDHYGLSPFEAGAKAVDIHNATGAWSKALLDNGARPSGALIYKGEPGADSLTEEQFARLKNELEGAYQGTANAGRPMVLEGGLEWKPLSHSPKDMDHIDAKHVAAGKSRWPSAYRPCCLASPVTIHLPIMPRPTEHSGARLCCPWWRARLKT